MKEKLKQKTALAISFVSSPALIGVFFVGYSFYALTPDFETFLKYFLVVLTFTIILPVLFHFYLLKSGKISNFHINKREERRLPFVFSVISSGISLAILRMYGIEADLFKILLIVYLMSLGFVIITSWKYKISGHIFIFCSSIFVLFSFLDIRFIYLLPLVIPIGWSRVHLEQHSKNEVFAGFLYSVISFIVFSLIING